MNKLEEKNSYIESDRVKSSEANTIGILKNEQGFCGLLKELSDNKKEGAAKTTDTKYKCTGNYEVVSVVVKLFKRGY